LSTCTVYFSFSDSDQHFGSSPYFTIMNTKPFETMDAKGLNIAVIGGGAAGLTAAYLLQKNHNVTIFEKDNRLGGHAHTLVVERGSDAGTLLDIGFMVLNDHNYPTMHRLLNQLGDIEIGESDMSFSYHSKENKLEYAYANPKSKFSRLKNEIAAVPTGGQKLDPRVIKIIKEIYKFGCKASQDLAENNLNRLTLGQYIEAKGFSSDLVNLYIIPSASAIWSTAPSQITDFPAATFLHFMNNHGMLTREQVPKWQYIKDGSRKYVNTIIRKFRGRIKTNSQIDSVTRGSDGVYIKENGNTCQFDYVVFGVHADQVLNLLSDPSEEEIRLLGAWKYQLNRTIVHTDISVMPSNREAWGSWNYTQELENDLDFYSVTYYLNRIQNHKHTQDQYFVTLNRRQEIPEKHILHQIDFTHPVYTFEAVNTQKDLTQLNGSRRTFLCGSYLGYGFHEDAIKSGVAVANQFNISL
jgi:predicted NAD/FAD-binding protein